MGSSFPTSQPLFVSLARQLRTRIESSEWPCGGRLPTERELADSYAVGINTVRRAVGTLVDDGVVTRRQGSGMYVTARPVARPSVIVGVVVPSLSYYFPLLLDGITQAADAAGVGLRLASSDYDDALELRRIRELVSSGAAGLLITPTLHVTDPTARLDLLRRLPIPVVLMERHPADPTPDDALSYISTDVVAGGYSAVRHLAGHDRRRIGFLGRSDTATADSVWEGYRRAMDDFGLERIDAGTVRLRAGGMRPGGDRVASAAASGRDNGAAGSGHRYLR